MTTLTSYVVTDKDTHFSGAIAQNGKEVESLTIPKNRLWVSNVVIISTQQLNFELWFFSKSSSVNTTDIDNDTYLGHVLLDLAAVGKSLGGVAPYYLNASFNPWLYENEDINANDLKMHIALVNRSSTSKAAGSSGFVVVKIGVQ